MESNLMSILVMLIGIALGCLTVWLSLRSKARQAYQAAKAESTAQLAIFADAQGGADERGDDALVSGRGWARSAPEATSTGTKRSGAIARDLVACQRRPVAGP